MVRRSKRAKIIQVMERRILIEKLTDICMEVESSSSEETDSADSDSEDSDSEDSSSSDDDLQVFAIIELVEHTRYLAERTWSEKTE